MAAIVSSRYPSDGNVHQIWQYIATTPDDVEHDPDLCRGCDAVLVHPPIGRPRRWCPTCRARRMDRKRRSLNPPKTETVPNKTRSPR